MPPPGVYVGLDWLRFTGLQDQHRDRLQGVLQTFAGTTPQRNRGAMYFTEGLLWEPGVLLSWGHRSGICMVDIQGGRLRLMSGDARMELLRDIGMLGMRPTRIDGCIDFVHQGHELYTHARSSCERDELCRLRSYGDNSRRTVGQRPDRLHLNLGRRDSPVCGRIYDKGLETKTTTNSGEWERLEIEWKDDRAQEIGQRLFCAGKEWAAELTALVFGAVDFREVNGQTRLNRRPRCVWWERVIGSSGEVVTSPASKSPDLTRWVDAFRLSYGRRIKEFARAVGRPGEEVVAWCLTGVSPSDNGGQLVREFVQAFRYASEKSDP